MMVYCCFLLSWFNCWICQLLNSNSWKIPSAGHVSSTRGWGLVATCRHCDLRHRHHPTAAAKQHICFQGLLLQLAPQSNAGWGLHHQVQVVLTSPQSTLTLKKTTLRLVSLSQNHGYWSRKYKVIEGQGTLKHSKRSNGLRAKCSLSCINRIAICHWPLFPHALMTLLNRIVSLLTAIVDKSSKQPNACCQWLPQGHEHSSWI